LLLEGGGHINGAFLQAGLVDEVSLLLVPGIDGRHEVPAVFDGVKPASKTAVPLKLKSVDRREKDTLWLRCDVSTTRPVPPSRRKIPDAGFGRPTACGAGSSAAGFKAWDISAFCPQESGRIPCSSAHHILDAVPRGQR